MEVGRVVPLESGARIGCGHRKALVDFCVIRTGPVVRMAYPGQFFSVPEDLRGTAESI